MPYDLNVDPNDPDAERKRRLWAAMQASINQKPAAQTTTVDPMSVPSISAADAAKADEWGRQHPDAAISENWGVKGGRPSMVSIKRRNGIVSIGPYDPRSPANPTAPAVNNPTGFAGGTLQGQIARDQQPRGPAVATPVDMSTPPPPPPSAPAINIPANASLAAPGMNPSALPNPSTPEAAGGFPAPPTSEQPAGRPGFAVGSSLGGLLGSERTSKILEAMRTADPESKVSTEGGNIDVSPPHMGGYGFKGRLKAAGKGLLLGLATGDPNAPQSAGIGRALGGLITGAVSPRTEAKIQRHYDIAGQEQDLARQLVLEKEKAGVEQAGMVPVSVSDGMGGQIITMVPKGKVPGVLASNARTNLGVRRVGQRATHEEKQLAARLYSLGAYQTPQQLQDAADTLEIPGELQPAFIRGEMRGAIDADGNIINVNQRTGVATPVTTQAGTPQASLQGKAEKDIDAAKAAARKDANDRAAAALAARKARGGGTKLDTKALAKGATDMTRHNAALLDFDNQIIELNKQPNSAEKNAKLKQLGEDRAAQVQSGAAKIAGLNVYDPEHPWKADERGYMSQSTQTQPASDLDHPIKGVPRRQAAPTATTHHFSIKAYQSKNPGASEADAKAYAAKNLPGYDVGP